MPKKSVTFISGFLIPSLNDGRFGEKLKWIDKEKTKFQIEWHHKGGPTWTEREAEVFAEWDKKKGHYQPNDEMYYPKSKQRFRSLLYKLTNQGYLKKLKSDEKFKKVYCIVREEKIKRKTCTSSESDLSNEGYDSSEELDDANEIYRRIISDDEITNILEDHTYSCIDQAQNASSDSEKEQEVTDCVYVQIQVPTSFYEQFKYLEKNILTEKNHLFEEIIHRPIITDGSFMHCTSRSAMTYDEETPEVPFLQMPEFFSGNYSSISSLNLNKLSEEKRSCDFEVVPTMNVSVTDNETHELDYITDFINIDIAIPELDGDDTFKY